jgi:hypothetical protein
MRIRHDTCANLVPFILLFMLGLCGRTHAATPYYVSDISGSDTNNGLSWATAKATIQAAVDTASAGDTIWVGDGVYDTGSRLSPGQILCKSRVVIDKPLTVQSANGPSNTFIVGEGPIGDTATRCAWITNGVVLSGFTLTNGFTTALGAGYVEEDSGGGVWCFSTNSLLTNCILSGNNASYYGGGAYRGTLNNCILTGNSTSYRGGGASYSTLNNCMINENSASSRGGGTYFSTLNNCTIKKNSSDNGGGTSDGTLNNCTVSENSALSRGGGIRGDTVNNCNISRNSADIGGGAFFATLNNCTLSGNSASSQGGGASGGTARNTISYSNTNGNFEGTTTTVCYTNDPHFVDAASGNFRLKATSPCINSGLNQLAPTNATPYDLDGNPRIFDGTVDIGAYEYQGVDFVDVVSIAGPHGNIVPSGTIRTNIGTDILFTIQPELYYRVEDVTTNGTSAGAFTNFLWESVLANGTVTVSFVEMQAAQGTPHWWLASYGWTQDFDTVELLDTDSDGLLTWQEYGAGTIPTNSNSDGDQFNDGVEVGAGADPMSDDSVTYSAIISNPDDFGFYTSNSVFDLSFGESMMALESNTVRVGFQLMMTEDLKGNSWSNVGDAIEWSYPVPSEKAFFRFLSGPSSSP